MMCVERDRASRRLSGLVQLLLWSRRAPGGMQNVFGDAIALAGDGVERGGRVAWHRSHESSSALFRHDKGLITGHFVVRRVVGANNEGGSHGLGHWS